MLYLPYMNVNCLCISSTGQTIRFCATKRVLVAMWSTVDSSGDEALDNYYFGSMSTYCGLQTEDSKAIFLHGTGSWWCITIPCLVTKDSTIQKISSRQTLTEILDLYCDLGLEHKSIQKIQSFDCMFWHRLLEWPIIKISLVAKILLVQLAS